MQMCVPRATVKVKTSVPWMNQAIRKAMKKRDSLFRVAKRSSDPTHWSKYKHQRNYVVKLLRKSKQDFFQQLNTRDAKTFWKTVRILNRQESSIPALEVNNTIIDTGLDKARALNNFFYSCFNHNHPTIQETTLDYQLLSSIDCPSELLCTEEGVYEELTRLDVTKSVGSDGISGKMLKMTAISIAPQLTTLFNNSISTGRFPSDWKVGQIVPIPKGKQNNKLTNYRPISVLPIVSKLIEKHMKAKLEEHLQTHAPISQQQWGFMSSRSSISALIQVVDSWAQAFDQGYEICVIFFDIQKSFDTVPHLLLLEKLRALEVNPYLLRWIESYLANRTQYVGVDGYDSHNLPVISGVPQGSILGPLLFITYINDVSTTKSQGSKMNLFADDIALYRVIKTPSDYHYLQADVNAVGQCISQKYLKFNANKCKIMLISRKRVHTIQPPNLALNGEILEYVTSYKYLGITFTTDLSWDPHISNICAKTRRIIGLLYRRFYRDTSPAALLKLYLSYIRPHLEYSATVWNPYLKQDIDNIENVQKYALRVCLKSWDCSYDQLLVEYSLPSMQQEETSPVCVIFIRFTMAWQTSQMHHSSSIQASTTQDQQTQ